MADATAIEIPAAKACPVRCGSGADHYPTGVVRTWNESARLVLMHERADRVALRSPWRWPASFGCAITASIGIAMIPYRQATGIPGVLIGIGVTAGSVLMMLWFVWWRRVEIRDDVLRVRDGWTAREFRRSAVVGVEVERSSHSVAQYPVAQPVLVLADGKRFSLSFLQQLGLGKRARRRVERYVAEIEKWLGVTG